MLQLYHYNTTLPSIRNAHTSLSPVPARPPARERGSPAVQRRDEDDLVLVLEHIVELALELPVGRVDQDEDPGAAAGGRGSAAFARSARVPCAGFESESESERRRRKGGRDAHRVALREQLGPLAVLEDVLPEPPHEEPHVRLLHCLVFGTEVERRGRARRRGGREGGRLGRVEAREGEGVGGLVREEELHAAAGGAGAGRRSRRREGEGGGGGQRQRRLGGLERGSEGTHLIWTVMEMVAMLARCLGKAVG